MLVCYYINIEGEVQIMLYKLGVYFVSIGIVKLLVVCVLKWRDKKCQ